MKLPPLPSRRKPDLSYGYPVRRRGAPPLAVAAAAVVAIVAGWLLGMDSSKGTTAQSAAQSRFAEQFGGSKPASNGFEARLPAVLKKLDAARESARADLAEKKPPVAQAAAAASLARAWHAAATGLEPVASAAQTRLVESLRGGDAAYRRLAAAAREGDRAAYARAAAEVDTAEERLSDLLAGGI